MKLFFILFLSVFYIGAACGQGAPQREFRLPDVPATLTEAPQRADYLGLHYWDHFDFSDTAMTRCPEVTEQAFADFISILPHVPMAVAAVDTLFARASAERKMLEYFTELTEKYLYETASPLYNEELYILVLRVLSRGCYLNEEDKLRFCSRLESALKNRPGDIAGDFGFLRQDGGYGRLREVESEYILLYFYDPDCEECRRVKGRLTSSSVIGRMLRKKRLAVISVCVTGASDGEWTETVCPDGWLEVSDEGSHLLREGIYDLKTVPVLYLLDREKRVLLKNASPEQAEQRLVEKYH